MIQKNTCWHRRGQNMNSDCIGGNVCSDVCSDVCSNVCSRLEYSTTCCSRLKYATTRYSIVVAKFVN